LELILTANPKAPIRFSGEVKFAGTTFATKGRRLSEVLSEAQPTDLADINAIQVRSGSELLIVDSAKEDPELKPGDKVLVPRQTSTKQVFVLGAVKKPGGIPFTEGLTAKKAVELAGGASVPGDLNQVRIDRYGNSLGVVDFSFGDAPLQVGDTVIVPFKANAPYVMVVGGAVRPGRVFFEEGLTLRKAIEAVGGAKLIKGKVRIVRTENGKTITQTLELSTILEGRAPDVLLKPNDRVELPEGFA
jgi:protein involved in polysaccharide export with SLBB domain